MAGIVGRLALTSGLCALWLASPSAAQVDVVTITNLRMERPGSTTPIDPLGVFEIGHPGTLVGDVAFQAHAMDGAGSYLAPNLSTMWRIEESSHGHLGDVEWYGGYGDPVSAPLTSFNATTGAGVAEVRIPIGGEEGIYQRPHLPVDGAVVDFVLGETGLLSYDALGAPVGHEWEGSTAFATELPARLALMEDASIAEGEGTQFVLLMDPPLASAQVATLEVVGPGRLIPAGQVAQASWDVALVAGTRELLVDFWATQPGSYMVKATLTDGTTARTQLSMVEIDPLVLLDAQGQPDPMVSSDVLSGVEKYCRQAYGAQNAGGDKLINCSETYFPMFQDPPNPDCGALEKVVLYPTKCLARRDSECETSGEVWVEGPKMIYAGTETIDCGSHQIKVGVSASGEVSIWLVGSVETEGSFEWSGTAEAKKRCCKYIPDPNNGTAGRNEPKCL